MAEPHDELLNRAIDELRTLPPLDRDAVSRIVNAASRSRDAGAADDVDLELPRRGRFFRLPAVIGIAAAAAIVGFVAGVQLLKTSTQPVETALARVATRPPTESSQIMAAAGSPNGLSVDQIAVPTQFVFNSRVAHRVALVGDFNGWDATATYLTREEGGALWRVTVNLLPGRHVYAFMVDDALMQTDPTAPETTDPDFGVKGSVIIVGKP